MSKKIETIKFLGEGAFSTVDLVKVTEIDETSQYLAMKSSNMWRYPKKEIQILSKLRGCPGVVQCHGDKVQEDVVERGRKIRRIFMEYAEEGSLHSLMNKHVKQQLPDPMIRKFTRMILEGLVSIHSHDYIHCDLKPGNILVFPRYVLKNGELRPSYEVKITDFGLSREKGEEDDWWDPECPFWATPLYMSPESVKEGKIGEALDIWSLGCIVLEMYTGQPPWPLLKEADIMNVLMNDTMPEIPDSVPSVARQFLETCFARNPEERGNAVVMLSHPFFHGDEYEPETFVPVTEKQETEKKPNGDDQGLQHQEAIEDRLH